MTKLVISICIAFVFVASVPHNARAGIPGLRRERSIDIFKSFNDAADAVVDCVKFKVELVKQGVQGINDGINGLFQGVVGGKPSSSHPGDYTAETTTPKFDPNANIDDVLSSLNFDKTSGLEYLQKLTTSRPTSTSSSSLDDIFGSLDSASSSGKLPKPFNFDDSALDDLLKP